MDMDMKILCTIVNYLIIFISLSSTHLTLSATINTKMTTMKYKPLVIQLQLLDQGFFVNFSIGQPPVPQLALMDIGSDLTWVTCWPYTTKMRGTYYKPNYVPSRSSTYSEIPCGQVICSSCDYSNRCIYRINREEQSSGQLATEEFTFENLDEGDITARDVVFGCNHDNRGGEEEIDYELPDYGDYGEGGGDDQPIIGEEDTQVLSGIFGLGGKKGAWSLLHIFGLKFSYCIGNISVSTSSSNKLVLGEAVMLEGYPIPFSYIDGKYYVPLTSISIGDKKLDIDPNIFKKTGVDNGVVIDSISAYTWIPKSVYQTIYEEIESLYEDQLTRYLKDPAWQRCYYGRIKVELHGFPGMILQFGEDEAELVLDAWSMFEQMDPYVFCLAFGPSESNGDQSHKDLTTIGILAQQNHNVAFDLIERELYFQRTDCDKLSTFP